MHVLAPFISCVVNLPLGEDDANEFDAAVEAGYTEIYVVSAAGIIKHHRLRGENRFIRVKVDAIPGYAPASIGQAIQFLPAGKIPKELFDQVVKFFAEVVRVHGDRQLEAMIWICHNDAQGYHLIVPTQEVGGASVKYDWDIPQGTSIIVDIHSHGPNISAFFSATDNQDDNNGIRYSGVVGNLKSLEKFDTVFRFNYMERKFEANFGDIFDVPNVPQEWMENVHLWTPPPVKYQSYQNGYPKSESFGRPGNWKEQSDSLAEKEDKYGHLRQYQYKPKADGAENSTGKGGGASETGIINGNRLGPDLYVATKREQIEQAGRQSSFHGMGNSGDSKSPGGSFPSGGSRDLGFGDGGLDPDFLSTGSKSIPGSLPQEPVFTPVFWGTHKSDSVQTQQDREAAEEHLGKLQDSAGNPLLQDIEKYPRSLIEAHVRYDDLRIVHGQNVADSFCAIDNLMTDLSEKDGLLRDLIQDMFQLSSSEEQVKLFKSLFEFLPPKEREKIETQGL
jgi:PRTRC genetic system protein A